MKKFSTLIFAIITIAIFSSNSAFAQADTVIIPNIIDGTKLGAINKFINRDVDASGNRINPDRVYKLETGKIYILDGRLNSIGYDLTIIADKPDDENRPAIVAGDLGQFFHAEGDLTLKNIYVQTQRATGGSTWATIDHAKDGGRYVYEGCFFEGGHWTTIRTLTNDTKVFFTDCYFRNIENKKNRWNGVVMNAGGGPLDTLVMMNNTFFNVQSFAIAAEVPANLIKVVHNTFVNSIQWHFIAPHLTNAIISNNIFYNSHSIGSSESDRQLQEKEDGIYWGILNQYSLTPLYTDTLGISEVDRKIELNNNDWFYSQAVNDYLDANDTITGQSSMLNTRVQGWFDDAVDHPNMTESNTMNLEPEFTVVGSGDSAMAEWMTLWRAAQVDTNLAGPDFYYGWDPDNDRFGVQWPLPENLSYTNSTLLTGADGFPVGDLNWFPARKVDWVTSVEKVEGEALPESYSLDQNYPNPFNPETNISYSIHKSTDVKITVFNALGQTVNVLVNQKQNTGNYRVNWNGKDNSGNAVSSGVYFYTLKAGDYTSTRKMILLR